MFRNYNIIQYLWSGIGVSNFWDESKNIRCFNTSIKLQFNQNGQNTITIKSTPTMP